MKEFLIVTAALAILALSGSHDQQGARLAGTCDTALAGVTCFESVKTLKASTPN